MEPVPPTMGTPLRKLSLSQSMSRLGPRPEADAPRREVGEVEHRGDQCGHDDRNEAADPQLSSVGDPFLGDAPALFDRPLARGDAVERDRGEHDAEAGGERQVGIELLQACQHLAADVAGAELRRDHDDAERHHDHLVETQQDRLASQRHLHLAEQLRAGGPERKTDLGRHDRNLAEAEAGEPNRGRHREDQRGDHRGGYADAEERDARDEVDVGRHHLRRVEHRAQPPLGAVGEPGPDAERHTDQHGQRNRHQHDRQGDHRQVPEAEEPDGEHRRRGKRRGAPAGAQVADRRRPARRRRSSSAARSSERARSTHHSMALPIDLIASRTALRPVFCVIQWYASWACCCTCRLSHDGTSWCRVTL